MNWLLVVTVANMPVQNNLVYRLLDKCMVAESRMRCSHLDLANVVLKEPNMSEKSKQIRSAADRAGHVHPIEVTPCR